MFSMYENIFTTKIKQITAPHHVVSALRAIKFALMQFVCLESQKI